jgi:hypothetical protein
MEEINDAGLKLSGSLNKLIFPTKIFSQKPL